MMVLKWQCCRQVCVWWLGTWDCGHPGPNMVLLMANNGWLNWDDEFEGDN